MKLGILKQVDVRSAWQSEPRDFTPWLAREENLRLLSEAIGLPMELEAQEKSVGPFSADIVCRDINTGDLILIENQLERTDHIHVGQLVTYAAGLDAVKIIWIAQRFTEEHRAALNWLNEITREGFDFFGLEIELWQIGDSPVAPKFNVVCQPNAWSKAVRESVGGDVSETRQMQEEFWEGFTQYLKQSHLKLNVPDPVARHSIRFPSGKSGVRYDCYFSTWNEVTGGFDGELRVTLVLKGSNSESLFRELMRDRETIEEGIGERVHWYEAEGVRRRRVYVSRQVDVEDRSQWPDYYAWLSEKLEAMMKTFGPRIAESD